MVPQWAGEAHVASPSESLQAAVVIHGGDFTSLGQRDGLRRYQEALERVVELKVKMFSRESKGDISKKRYTEYFQNLSSRD